MGTKVLGTKALHAYFFTEEASDDYLRMLVAIPQYIMSYTAKQDDSDKWRFVIPRRITQDFLENRYGDIKMKVKHNGLTAATVLPAVHSIEASQVQATSSRACSRKRNAGANGDNQGQGAPPVHRSVRSRFVPLDELAQLTLSRQQNRDKVLKDSGYTAAFEKLKPFSF